MKPTEQEIELAREAAYNDAKLLGLIENIGESAAFKVAWDVCTQWAISQMQSEITTLNCHNKQLREWIGSMTHEIKVLKTALKDHLAFSSDEELSEWLFDQDYHTHVLIKEKIELDESQMQPEWVATGSRTYQECLDVLCDEYHNQLFEECRYWMDENSIVEICKEAAEVYANQFKPQPPTK